MTRQVILIIFLLLSLAARGEKKGAADVYKEIDAKALALPAAQVATIQDIAQYMVANFKTDSEKARAIFIWVAANIEFDIDNMFAINFYEKKEEKIKKALATKKGVCEDYATVFTEVCEKCGIRSYVVVGYTKQNGFADYIPHAWSAALIDSSWFLFDPTWGSGYVKNAKFVKRINNGYYRVPPWRLIRSHMPFDPMWEFLNYPFTNQEFYQGKVTEGNTKPFFSFTDSIAAYVQLDSIEQCIAEARRIEANGVKNSLLFDRLQHLKMVVEVYRNNKAVNEANSKVDLYNSAVDDYNDGIVTINEFIKYRNDQFKPMKPDAEIQAMFDKGYNKILLAKEKMGKIKDPGPSIANAIPTMAKAINEVMTQVEEQKAWLQKYFSKNKMGRSAMFTKLTWMGVPIN